MKDEDGTGWFVVNPVAGLKKGEKMGMKCPKCDAEILIVTPGHTPAVCQECGYFLK